MAPLPLVIALSIIRFERMEWAIEKLTELGVAQIVPLERNAARSIWCRRRRNGSSAGEKSPESPRSNPAAPMCRRLPSRSSWRNGWRENGMECDCCFPSMSTPACCERSGNFFGSTVEKIYAAIGPEGGWTELELAAFARDGWQSVSLGPRILRAETAAIAMASVVTACLER